MVYGIYINYFDFTKIVSYSYLFLLRVIEGKLGFIFPRLDKKLVTVPLDIVQQ